MRESAPRRSFRKSAGQLARTASLWPRCLLCSLSLPRFVGWGPGSWGRVGWQATHPCWHVRNRVGASARAACKQAKGENKDGLAEFHSWGPLFEPLKPTAALVRYRCPEHAQSWILLRAARQARSSAFRDTDRMQAQKNDCCHRGEAHWFSQPRWSRQRLAYSNPGDKKDDGMKEVD